MRKLILSTLLAGLLSSTAVAADLTAPTPAYDPVMTAYDWSGAYVGIVGGYGWATGVHTDSIPVSSGPFNLDGGMIGGTVGYNWQRGALVFGVEADLAWADVNGATTVVCPTNCYTEVNAFGTLRGRLGYAFDRFMPYVTGGAAFANVEAGQTVGAFSNEEWVAGWTVGAGVEMAITEKVSAKLEGLYVDLEDARYTVVIPVDASADDFGLIRFGVNMRF
ncbi:MAG: acetylglucosamine transferase [Rhizobiales bacterium]|nr:acetylglucosamine transferase [Hyphomicrobiales bacterium]MBA67522.1 acetylglucosamine transferase [Hyphomicrobiales bacterium]|tara:strand:+ start:490 stop:1149 length:660 start_codon:yes stop_codon:yes gene_type:complete